MLTTLKNWKNKQSEFDVKLFDEFIKHGEIFNIDKEDGILALHSKERQLNVQSFTKRKKRRALPNTFINISNKK